MAVCTRCNGATRVTIMSIFNADIIGLDCKTAEERHPQYAEARAIELEHVKAGDYNFRGVGLPADIEIGNCGPIVKNTWSDLDR